MTRVVLRTLALDVAEGLLIFIGGSIVAAIVAIALLWWMVG
jgi:hypothetical protein